MCIYILCVCIYCETHASSTCQPLHLSHPARVSAGTEFLSAARGKLKEHWRAGLGFGHSCAVT